MELILGLETRPQGGFTPAARAQVAVWQQGIAIGFLGGLTTFSTFGADTLRALNGGQMRTALANIVANIVLALLAVWVGMAVVKAID